MADNLTTTTTVSTIPNSTLIATDQIPGTLEHYQKIKLYDAAADSTTGAGIASNPFQVSLANHAANATAVKVDGSGVTQPVSGTITANAGTGTMTVSGTVTANIGTGNLAGITGTVTVDTEMATAVGLGDAASATPTTTTVAAVGLVMNATSLDRQRAVVNALDSVGTGIAAAGLVGQLDDTSPSTVTENQFAPVRISSRRYLLSEVVPTVSAVNGLGSTPFFNSALTTTVTNVKTTAGNLYGWYIYNSNASVTFVQIFNATAVNVTLGTTTPILSLGIPTTSAANIWLASGVGFGTAISVAATTTATGLTAPAAGLTVNLMYQ